MQSTRAGNGTTRFGRSDSVRAIVTGGRGFVGRHLVAHLLERGDDVVVLDVAVDPTRSTSPTPTRCGAGSPPIAPDVVFHLAARSHVGASWNDEDAVQRVNVGGTANVLSAGVGRAASPASWSWAARRSTGASTPSAVPVDETTPLRPVSPYGRSKVAAEAAGARRAPRRVDRRDLRARVQPHGARPVPDLPRARARVAHRGRRTRRAPTTSPSGTSTPSATTPTSATSCARTGCSRSTARPGRSTTCAPVSGRTVADIAQGLVALASRPLRLAVDPELVRPVDVPILVGDGTRLRDATGWAPEIPAGRTLADVLDDARVGVA